MWRCELSFSLWNMLCASYRVDVCFCVVPITHYCYFPAPRVRKITVLLFNCKNMLDLSLCFHDCNDHDHDSFSNICYYVFRKHEQTSDKISASVFQIFLRDGCDVCNAEHMMLNEMKNHY